jgi:uncharacterized protein (DUF983 family)
MSKNNSTSGIGIGTIIFVIFLVLKLAEIGPVQYWSWWWVTSPLWIPFAIIIPILGIVALVSYMKIKNRNNG